MTAVALGAMTRNLHGWLILGSLMALAAPVTAAPEAETCDAIRAKIGQLPPADAELLRTLAIRQECRFTAAEVYRAAYGDKPMPKYRPRRHHRRHDDDDD